MNSDKDNEILERTARWESVEREVDKIVDIKGLGIDEGIKPAVIAFQSLNFPTSQSCEGHIHTEDEIEKHGLPYPWVEIYAPEPDGWRDNDEVQESWRLENLDLQRRMIKYLDIFYAERTSPFDAQLGFRYIGMFGGFRIQSTGGEVMELLTQDEQNEKHVLYRKEMDEFAEFLKRKYFTE